MEHDAIVDGTIGHQPLRGRCPKGKREKNWKKKGEENGEARCFFDINFISIIIFRCFIHRISEKIAMKFINRDKDKNFSQ